MFIQRHYEDPSVLHENTMPNRAYYIPASHRADFSAENRECSDRFQLLSGEWDFRYFASIYEAKERFFEASSDTSCFEKVHVPGIWQYYGHDYHQYTNFRYPIPFDPPFVPQDNPCGEYIRVFEYTPDAAAPRVYLNFEGVDSCFYVWLNGCYIGYSQVSHSTSEFDVTGIIVPGKNRLAVLVLKWCDGTYFEDQDKFRMSGIFRDVYLLKRPVNFIFDYFVHTLLSDDKADISVQIKPFTAALPVNVKLYDAQDHLVGSSEARYGCSSEEFPLVAEISVKSPHLWNAEQPYLYTMVLETENEVITETVGIRQIEIKNNNIVCLNGKPVKLRGVNRHDSDPREGYAVGIEHIKSDLRLMKEYNFNAIRTSHYPNSPIFSHLCDRYGFYLIDEADNESHGTSEIYFKDDDWDKRKNACPLSLVDNPDYNETVLDRVQRCVCRDKNRPSILIWSMGNECFYGCTIENALAWTRRYDPSRLTHYEGVSCKAKYREFDESDISLKSRMYPPLKDITAYLDNHPAKPFILCEYCHAMGNGPGDLEDYFELIQKYDAFCGAFVWEWCDHAIYKGTSPEGKPIYYYGGDHGETLHDGNFCVDGLVHPDREPYTSVLEYQNVHRPARIIAFHPEDSYMTIRNYLDFTNLEDAADLEWELTCDGILFSRGRIEQDQIPSIAPHAEASIPLSLYLPQKGHCFFRLIYRQKTDGLLVPKGALLGFDEVEIHTADDSNQLMKQIFPESCSRKQPLCCREDDGELRIYGADFSLVYNKRTGMIDQIKTADKALFTEPMEINLWRAPTDNDRYIRAEWERACYHLTCCRAYESTWTNSAEGVCIESRLSVSSAHIQRILNIRAKWIILSNGMVRLSFDVVKDPQFPDLPRFGIRMFLPRDMDRVSYFGMGPSESYRDKHRAAYHGLFDSSVEDLYEDYIRPQENGSHYDCDYVTVSGDGTRLSAAGELPFSFNASVYSQEELTGKKHNYELIPGSSTILCIDYAQNGIGSNSCGPVLIDRYRFRETHFQFSLQLGFAANRD